MKRFGFSFLAGLLALVSTAAAARAVESNSAPNIRILTTFLPGYCFAANVAGEAAVVENLLQAGVSLHDYQLSPRDIRKIAEADVIVINGLGMEAFLDRAIQNAGPGTRDKLVILSAEMHDELIHEDAPHQHARGEHHHSHDPHIWLDPMLAVRAVRNLVAGLQKADSANADLYARNAAKYIERLNALDAEIARTVEPVKQVPFVTYHNAFRYFVRRYSLSLAGVVEKVPEISPSSREMSALFRTIREKKVKALFTEPGAPPRLAQQIARDAKIKLAELDPLETGQFDPAAYEQGMRRNAQTLLESLR